MGEPTFQGYVVDSFGRTVVICTVVLVFLMLLTTLARIVSRRMKNACIGSDDAAIILATILTLALAVVQIWGVFHAGFGGVFEFAAESYARNQKAVVVIYMLFSVTSGLVKVAVLLFYKRIFETPRFLLMSNCLIIASVLWAVLDFFLLPRFPLYLNWELQSPPRPTDIFEIFLSLTVVDIVLDLAILGLPVPIIWRMNLSTMRKSLLIVIFLMGAFAVVASVLRLVYIIYGFQHQTSLTADRLALEVNGRRVLFWLVLDCPVSVIAANLPVLGLPAELGQRMYRALQRVKTALTRRKDTSDDSKAAALEMASPQRQPRPSMKINSRQQPRSAEGQKLRHMWRAIRVSGERSGFGTLDESHQDEQSPVRAAASLEEHGPSTGVGD